MDSKLGNSQETKHHWESYYRRYTPIKIPWGEGQPAAQLVELVQSGLLEKGSTLDLGTGTGDNAVYLAQQGYTSFGIDISETSVRQAIEKAAHSGVTCDFSVGDATDLSYADNMFNLVFDRGCFHSIALQTGRLL